MRILFYVHIFRKLVTWTSIVGHAWRPEDATESKTVAGRGGISGCSEATVTFVWARELAWRAIFATCSEGMASNIYTLVYRNFRRNHNGKVWSFCNSILTDTFEYNCVG